MKKFLVGLFLSLLIYNQYFIPQVYAQDLVLNIPIPENKVIYFKTAFLTMYPNPGGYTDKEWVEKIIYHHLKNIVRDYYEAKHNSEYIDEWGD